MFEAYSVGVTLRMNNLVSASLLQIGQEFKLVQGYSDALRASLKATELEAKGLAAALRSINAATPGRRSAAARAADDTAAAFNKATEAVQKHKTAVQGASMATPHAGAIHSTSPLFAHAIAAQQSAIAATIGPSLVTQMAMAQRMSSVPAMTHHLPGLLAQQAVMAGGGAPPYGPYPAAPRLAGPAGMPYTPFRMRTPGGVGGAGAGGGGGGGAGPHLVPPGGGGGGGMLPMIGPMGVVLPLAAAAATIHGGKALYESARDYETGMTRFRTLNLGDKANTEADHFARRTQVKGVSSTQLLETLRESVGMFGSMSTAMQMAPVIAQLNSANAALFSGKIGRIDEGAARSLMRFNDMRGLTNSSQDFMRGLNLAQRMVTGSGGALKFNDLEQMAKMGGAAFKGMSDDGVMMMSTLAQEQGGARTGTALMSMYQNFIAGRVTKKAMLAMEAAGLVTLKQVKTGTVGGKQSTSTVIDTRKDEELMRQSPGLWLMNVGLPAAKKMGAKTDSEIIAVVNSWFSNRTASNMGANFTTQSLEALRDYKGTKNAMGASESIAAFQKSAAGSQTEFVSAWRNFKIEFGTAALPAFTKILTAGSGFLRDVNTFANSPGTKSFIAMYERGNKAVGGLMDTYRDGFKRQGDMLGKAGNFLFGDKQATGAPVAGQDTDGGAFTGYRVPYRTAAARDRQTTINNTIVMPDGRVLAKVVTEHQAKELSRPQTGPRTADGRMSLRAFDLSTGG